MKNQIFNKRIPTFLGIILVLLGIFLTTFIIKSQNIFRSSASNSQEPQNIKVTNASDQSFTITYQTGVPATGSISYGQDKTLGKSGLDDTDKKTGSFTSKKNHSISVDKLTPDTKYYLTIISGSNTYLNNGVPFEILTGQNISSPSANQNDIKGKIVLPDGSAAADALVYLSAENSQLLSSTTAKDGKFSFSLKDLRINDLSSYFNVNDSTVFKIVATNGPLTSTVSASLGQTNSIPTITLSNNYDFTQESLPIASKSAQFSSFPSIIPLEKNLKPQIINPKANQSFTDPKPQFRGTGLPNEKVEIIIHSDERITTQITADSNGNWTYKPPNNLSPGIHTITIKTRDSSGILTTIVQSFTVLAAGNQVSGNATPSAAPIPTLTLTPTPVIMPLNLTITPTPILILSPPPTFIQELKGGLPPTGNSPVGLVIGGIAATLTGIVLFLLAQKMPL